MSWADSGRYLRDLSNIGKYVAGRVVDVFLCAGEFSSVIFVVVFL